MDEERCMKEERPVGEGRGGRSQPEERAFETTMKLASLARQRR